MNKIISGEFASLQSRISTRPHPRRGSSLPYGWQTSARFASFSRGSIGEPWLIEMGLKEPIRTGETLCPVGKAPEPLPDFLALLATNKTPPTTVMIDTILNERGGDVPRHGKFQAALTLGEDSIARAKVASNYWLDTRRPVRRPRRTLVMAARSMGVCGG